MTFDAAELRPNFSRVQRIGSIYFEIIPQKCQNILVGLMDLVPLGWNWAFKNIGLRLAYMGAYFNFQSIASLI